MQAKGGTKKNNYFYIAIILLLLVFLSFSFTYFYLILNSKVIAKGIFVNGISIGGMTKDEAADFLKDKIKISSFSITAKYQDKDFVITSEDINLSYNYQEMVDEAYKIGREGNPIARMREIYITEKEGKYFNFYPKYNGNKLKEFVDKISQEIDKEPVNAKIKIIRGVRQITPDVDGVKVDKEKTLKNLKQLIDELVKGKTEKTEVEIVVEKVEAKISKSMLEMINGRISTFSTVFNLQDTNRSENILVAARAVNDTLLMPGETFSLNKTLGPRIIQNGYKEAPVIIDNKLVPDIGGGVCQIATTLYNAILRADIAITERYHHSFPVAYVPPGQDATISGDALDLKFENSTQYPIYIESYIEGNKLIMNIYGYVKNPSKWVDIQSEVVEKYDPKIKYIDDPTLPQGEEVVEIEPHAGYKVNTYRLIYENNKLVKREFLYTDIYKPVDGVIKRGTKKVENSKFQELPKTEKENNAQINPEPPQGNPEEAFSP
jgi:vancomycin resistance protein YoaR